MKCVLSVALTLTLLLGLPACGEKAPTWQEQYELGVRYLEESNYEEAIIAFAAAIEIDPNRALAYVGRGDAYIGSGETEETLAVAQADFEQAIELDEANAAAYLGLADVYIRRAEYDEALNILKKGSEKTGSNQAIADKIAEIEQGNIVDSFGNPRRMTFYDGDGHIKHYQDWFYNEKGKVIKTVLYNKQGISDSYAIFSYNNEGQETRCEWYGADGGLEYYSVKDYNGYERVNRETWYEADGTISSYSENEYDSNQKQVKTLFYYFVPEKIDFVLTQYNTYQYDDSGRMIRENLYDGGSGKSIGYSIFLYNDAGKNTGSVHYSADGELTSQQVNS